MKQGAPSILTADDYPPAAFHFKVAFSATLGLSDTSFQEVSGISVELKTEPVVEGGENRYVHQLPTTIEHPKLVLKRGIGKISSPLVCWCKSVFESDFMLPVVPMPIVVFLLDEKAAPCRAWSFMNTYPVSWIVDEFNSTKNEVAIEKIELNYNYSNRLI